MSRFAHHPATLPFRRSHSFSGRSLSLILVSSALALGAPIAHAADPTMGAQCTASQNSFAELYANVDSILQAAPGRYECRSTETLISNFKDLVKQSGLSESDEALLNQCLTNLKNRLDDAIKPTQLPAELTEQVAFQKIQDLAKRQDALSKEHGCFIPKKTPPNFKRLMDAIDSALQKRARLYMVITAMRSQELARQNFKQMDVQNEWRIQLFNSNMLNGNPESYQVSFGKNGHSALREVFLGGHGKSAGFEALADQLACNNDESNGLKQELNSAGEEWALKGDREVLMITSLIDSGKRLDVRPTQMEWLGVELRSLYEDALQPQENEPQDASESMAFKKGRLAGRLLVSAMKAINRKSKIDAEATEEVRQKQEFLWNLVLSAYTAPVTVITGGTATAALGMTSKAATAMLDAAIKSMNDAVRKNLSQTLMGSGLSPKSGGNALTEFQNQIVAQAENLEANLTQKLDLGDALPEDERISPADAKVLREHLRRMRRFTAGFAEMKSLFNDNVGE